MDRKFIFSFKDFFKFLKWFFTQAPSEGGFSLEWNCLPTEVRYIGFFDSYYDGSHYCFGFWFWHFYISEDSSNHFRAYQYSVALQEAVKTNPELHLLSSNKEVRKAAQFYLKTLER